MYNVLYNEVFQSMKEVSQTKNILIQQKPADENTYHEAKREEWILGPKIVRDLLGEYLSRVVKMLKEPKIVIHCDTMDM